MVHDTNATAVTESVEVAGTRFAYRRFGRPGASPLLLLNYFSANLDDWDPQVTDGLAAEREVVLFDYPGVGASTGTTPSTVADTVEQCADFCRALGLRTVTLVGFSLGGMVAQQLAAVHPELVDRMVLMGTGPRGGEGMSFTELSAAEQEDPTALIMGAFFTASERSAAAGRAYLDRLKQRADRDQPVTTAAAAAQLAAIREWGAVPDRDRYAMLGDIRTPTLVVHGGRDVVVLPVNAFVLAQHLPDATLLMFPDASHAAHSQYAEAFLEFTSGFLAS